MAACWFHTAFVTDGKLQLTKMEMDKACKDKKGVLGPDFGMLITFLPPGNAVEEAESRGTLLAKAELSEPNNAGTSVDDDDEEEQDDDDDHE